jgi:hypothetical protein
MDGIDPFNVFRTAVFVGVTTYTVLALAGTMMRLAAILRGSDPEKRLLRAVLSYELVSMRLRPLLGELWQLAFWSAALLGIWWLHAKV